MTTTTTPDAHAPDAHAPDGHSPGRHGMPGADTVDDHGPHEAPHGSLSGYLAGFLLSVVLTAVPFWLVMGMPLPSPAWTGALVVGCAAVQIVVHMVFFLHMSPKAEGGWTALALGFTLVLLVVMLSGTLWVMYHLETNMMPPRESVM